MKETVSAQYFDSNVQEDNSNSLSTGNDDEYSSDMNLLHNNEIEYIGTAKPSPKST